MFFYTRIIYKNMVYEIIYNLRICYYNSQCFKALLLLRRRRSKGINESMVFRYFRNDTRYNLRSDSSTLLSHNLHDLPS